MVVAGTRTVVVVVAVSTAAAVGHTAAVAVVVVGSPLLDGKRNDTCSVNIAAVSELW